MEPPRPKKFVFQKRQKQYHEHCCVPECTASSTYSAGLSFHAFPSDETLRRRWLIQIRRDQFVVSSHSKVCSRHFLPGDISEAKSEGGKRRLKKGVVPMLFQWNNYQIPPSRPGVWDRVVRPPLSESFDEPSDDLPMESTNVMVDHDSAAVDITLAPTEEVVQLREQVRVVSLQMEELKIQATFGLQRFAGSDDDIRFYTR